MREAVTGSMLPGPRDPGPGSDGTRLRCTLEAQNGAEPPDDANQIMLGPHDGMDVLVGIRGFIDEVLRATMIEPDAVHALEKGSRGDFPSSIGT